MKKAKIIAIIMAVVLAITCLASSLSVFAKTQTITLDTLVTNTNDGSED